MTDRERIAPSYMRRALRDAVKEVLGNKNSAVIGDDLAAALEAAGYAIYRPDDCAEATVEHGGSYPDPYTGEEREAEPVLRSKQIETTRCILKLGTYRLVPVGGDS